MTFPYKISLTKIQIGSDARHHFVHDACRIELSCSDGAHRWLIDGLSLLNRVDEVIESNGVRVALHARCSRRQPIHDDARLAMPDERRAGPHPHSRDRGGWSVTTALVYQMELLGSIK